MICENSSYPMPMLKRQKQREKNAQYLLFQLLGRIDDLKIIQEQEKSLMKREINITLKRTKRDG